MKIINIHPRVPGCKEQQAISGTIGDALFDIANAVEDLRYRTLMEDDEVLFVATHQFAIEGFREVMEQGRVDLARVKFLVRDHIEKVIHIPATNGSQLVNAFSGEVESDLGPQPATKRKVKIDRYLDWGKRKDVRHIASKAKDAEVIVVWEPVEGDLEHLSELPRHIDLVVYHRVSEKVGVVIEGGDANPDDVWDTKSEIENEPDLPWLIENISHTGESTWFGALPKVGKTWIMLCVAKALLTGDPLFGDKRFTAKKAQRVIYLCPEAGRASIKRRLHLLGLIEYLYDPITNPDGVLYLQTLSKKKLALTDPLLLGMAKGADIFVDTAVRYLEGSENDVEDVKVVTENVLNLLSVGARSVWVAHHSAKGFENASTMTLGNMFRGSGEFGAALTNAYGLCTEDAQTTKIRLHCICGRDLDELVPDMILQGRPYINDTGNFGIITTEAEPFTGNNKGGRKADPSKQQKIDFARTIEGSLQQKIDAVNERFGSKHDKSTIAKWLKEFDENTPSTSKLLEEIGENKESSHGTVNA